MTNEGNSQVRVALGQIVSSIDPARNLQLVADAAAQAAAAGRRPAGAPGGDHVRLRGVAGPDRRTARRAVGDRGPGDRRRPRHHRRGRHVHPRLRWPGAEHPAGHRPRGARRPTTRSTCSTPSGSGSPRPSRPVSSRSPSRSTVSTVGLTTCYDIRFPGLYQALGPAGARRDLLVAASWGAGPGQTGAVGPADQGQGAGQHQLPAGRRAGRPGVHRPAAAGSAPTGVGGSVAVSPLGEVLAQLDDKPDLLLVDIDPEQVDRGPPGPPRARQPPLLTPVTALINNDCAPEVA